MFRYQRTKLAKMEKEANALIARISLHYQDGIDVYPNEAFVDLNTMSQSNPFALSYVGECYHQGWIVEKNVIKGLELFQRSADLRADTGMFYLARAYENGLGVEVDLEKAAYWHLEAVKNDVKMGKECLEMLAEIAKKDPDNKVLKANAGLIKMLDERYKKREAEGPSQIIVKNKHALSIFHQFYKKKISEQLEVKKETENSQNMKRNGFCNK